MRLTVISLLVMFLAVSSALATPREYFNKGNTAFEDGNYKQAVKWLSKAAEQGDVLAQYNLGWMYANGQGVVQDYKQAVKWYSQAAEQGYASAQTNLGVMYAEGQGVAQNYKTAIKWYRQAAEQGVAGAQYNLGVMYSNGTGVAKDYKTAIKRYRQAAEQGYANAQHNLGWMYFMGQGVIRNGQTAYMFYLLALANEQDKSLREIFEKAVTSMEKQLTATQIQSAQNDAVKYQAKIDARQ